MPSVSDYQEQFFNLTTSRKYHDALALVDRILESGVDQKAIIIDVIANTLQKLQSFDEDPNSSGYSSLTLLAIARICDDSLKKILARAPVDQKYHGTVVIGTPLNEFHSLGKTIVAAFLRFYNWKVYDIGLNVKTDVFIAKAEELEADYILVSTFLLPSALKCAEIASALKTSRLAGRMKLMVGGPPFNFHLGLAEKLGCDATAVDAFDTVRVLNQIHGIETETARKMERTKRFQLFKKRVFNVMKRRK
ncbi:MAG: B12-binding domain-containing protein [Candidatus Odinarchaeota archaeon]